MTALIAEKDRDFQRCFEVLSEGLPVTQLCRIQLDLIALTYTEAPTIVGPQ
jgi:hypothetical protein